MSEIHEAKSELAIEALRASGCLRLKVRGNSMLPSLWPGDLASIEAKAFSDIQTGDIILYCRGTRFFIHRVRGKNNALTARGDCMPQADPPVAASELLGKVVSVRRYGTELSPPQFSWLRRVQAFFLRHSEFLQRVALWSHAARIRYSTAIPEIRPEYSIQ
jgi:hypothetical protein